MHQGADPYRARLDVAPGDGVWKRVGLDLMDEERLGRGRVVVHAGDRAFESSSRDRARRARVFGLSQRETTLG